MDFTYKGWCHHFSNMDAPHVNEILAYAHPRVSVSAEEAQEHVSLDDPETLANVTDEQASRSENGTPVPPRDVEAELAIQQNSTELSECIKDLCTTLEIDNRCNLCAIVSICVRLDSNSAWFLDYGLLCYKSTVAPRTAMSTLIVTMEFMYLLNRHFKNIKFDNLFSQKILTTFDFQTHFFINRCFAGDDRNPVLRENLTLNYVNVTKAILTRDNYIPYNKHRRPIGPRKTPALKQIQLVVEENEDEAANILKQHAKTSKSNFTNLLFYIWSGTNVFFNVSLTNLAIRKNHNISIAYLGDERIEHHIGPIYLSPVPVFAIKNNTTTVCLLCELMACSHQHNVLLRHIRSKITNYCRNNIKLIDKIQLTLADILRASGFQTQLGRGNKDLSEQVFMPESVKLADDVYLDRHAFIILKQVGITGLYKHFFCDPQCAINIRATNPDVLFADIDVRYLRELKLAICYSSTYTIPVEPRISLFAQTFKAFQTCNRNFKAKTHLADFLREFNHVLEESEIHLIEPSYVVDKYV
uniref:Packaging protein UL32 n=1 Tax=Caviid herpesvirus 2 str. CIDMTR TaxID=1415526 RepID=U6H8D4_9BETA|nr:GP52 [Caviid herpesvirus 2 str. CIDMTR]